jgi:diacylglycerol kinase family enzyme
VRCVVAAGGDGTVASVINELAADVPPAVMGLGNENLFARALALPADPLALAPLWTALHATVQADLRGHQLATKASGGLTCPMHSGRIAAK